MSWAGTESQAMEVVLGRTGWSACRGGALIHAERALAESIVLQSVLEWLAREAGGQWWAPTPVAVYLSGALCRPFLLPELPALTNDERRLAIDAAARKRTGLSGDLRVWLSPLLEKGQAEGGAHQLGAAVQVAVIRDVVSAFRRAHKLKLSSIRPLWSLALQVALSEKEVPDMLLVLDPDSVAIFAGAQDGSSGKIGDRNNGFAAAIAVEASLDAGLQRNAVMRLVSGLDHEPQRACQFFLSPGLPHTLKAPPAEGAANPSTSSPVAPPLSALWTLDAFDLTTA